MPSKNISYSCCICGTVYKDLVAAEECEKAHKVPTSVDKPQYKEKEKDRKSDYPLSVLVQFADNTSARYYRK